MPISTQEKIKNTPLNGQELRDYALWLLRSTLQKHEIMSELQIQEVCNIFLVDMGNDYVFSRGTMYPHVEIDIEFRSHLIEDRWSFDLTPIFNFPNPTHPTHTVFIHRPTTIPKPPLPPSETAGALIDEHVVDCFRLKIQVENPNLVRVHLGMPIVITRSIMPDRAKNRPMVTFEEQEILYDAKDYDPLPQAKETDLSRGFAREWGLQGDIEFPAEDAKVFKIAEDQLPFVIAELLEAEKGELLEAVRPPNPQLIAHRQADVTAQRKRAMLMNSGIELTDAERQGALRAMGLKEDDNPLGARLGEQNKQIAAEYGIDLENLRQVPEAPADGTLPPPPALDEDAEEIEDLSERYDELKDGEIQPMDPEAARAQLMAEIAAKPSFMDPNDTPKKPAKKRSRS